MYDLSIWLNKLNLTGDVTDYLSVRLSSIMSGIVTDRLRINAKSHAVADQKRFKHVIRKIILKIV